MNRDNTKEFFNSYDAVDYYSAKEIFNAWQSQQAQEIEDFMIRQRKAELNALVKRVIENELRESDKILIDLKWNKDYSNEKIAAILGVNISSVYRRIEKINDILYEKLKYALEYRFGKRNEKAAVLVKQQIPLAARIYGEKRVSERLKALREKQMISVQELEKMTEIPACTIEKIESGQARLTVSQLIALANFFRVSSDYILFGKKRVVRDPYTGLPTEFSC